MAGRDTRPRRGSSARGDRRRSGDRSLPGYDATRLAALGVTRRELSVLELIARGRTNEEIASILCLSRLTVKKHVERMCAKVGAANRAALVAVAYQRSR